MTQITAALVKELRDRTGLGMMECKKSLVETDGDVEKAIDLLRKSSGMKAAKKAGRIAAEGVVAVAINDGDQSAVIIEVNCETDFVAKDESFLAFVGDVVAQAQSDESVTSESLLTEELAVKREQLVQKIGENISVRRLARLHAAGSVSSYVHNNKIGVVVALDKANNDLGKDVAMHIAATNPMAISPEDVDSELLAKEREVYQAQAAESGKPQEIIDKMVEGRARKYLAEISLTEQAFVKDPDTKVGDLLKKSDCTLTGFYRFEVGEGIEKESIDFAEEVRQQAGI